MRKKIEKVVAKVRNKAVEKIMATAPKSGKVQRLVRLDNVEKRKSEGWIIVKEHKDNKQIDVSDLVLMER